MAETPPTVDEGPGLDRTITLTDAVVAIAMTLLILPLVDVVTELDVADLPALWAENHQVLQSFVISFLVIYAFWTAHGTLYRRLVSLFNAQLGLYLLLLIVAGRIQNRSTARGRARTDE